MKAVLINTASPLRLTEADLCAWLGDALADDQLLYHRGFLAVDCDRDTSRLPPHERTNLVRLAHRARLAQTLGLAHLVQRRNGPGDYSYIILARVSPRLRATHRCFA